MCTISVPYRRLLGGTGRTQEYHPTRPTLKKPAEITAICCAQGQSRTVYTRIFSPLLYQLSYLGVLEMLWVLTSSFVGQSISSAPVARRPSLHPTCIDRSARRAARSITSALAR